MDLALYAAQAVLVEKRSRREVAIAIGRSKSWVSNVVLAYSSGGEAALAPAKRGPKVGAGKTPVDVEDQVVAMRKALADEGLDAGASTIRFHLLNELGAAPSRSTIHRILVARGFVTPQPQKRPRSSWTRFEAALANETWQADACHWALGDGTVVDIITFIDDYSRMILGTKVVPSCTSIAVIDTFMKAVESWGFPASVLTDNGAPFTATYLGGINGFEVEMLARGVVVKHGKPFHPQTQGKIERYHRTLKAWLRRRPRAKTIMELEEQLEQFCRYYNETRPHSARGTTPRDAYDRSDKASPADNPPMLGQDVRVRRDRIDSGGKLTLRFGSKLRHLGVGRAHSHRRVIKLIQGPDVRVIDANSLELLARFTIDPDRNYQSATWLKQP